MNQPGERMKSTETILEVNLSTEKVQKKDAPKELIGTYLGGKGVGARVLFDQLKPKTDALGPENLLIFETGPLTGLNLSGAEKLGVVFKSPQTNIFGEAYCGGYFAPAMKKTGFDFIIVKGTAKIPVYLFINDDTIEIKKADHLWTKDTFQTEDILNQDHGKTSSSTPASRTPRGFS
jgi:aldehyde:ferredoxin oxidoreductase